MCFYILHMHGLLDVIQIWNGSKSCYTRLNLKPAPECAEFKTSGKIQEENFNCQQKKKKKYICFSHDTNNASSLLLPAVPRR